MGINLAEKTVWHLRSRDPSDYRAAVRQGQSTEQYSEAHTEVSRDIECADKYLSEYHKRYMLWSPVVKDSKGQLVYNQVNHLSEIGKNIKSSHGVDLDFVVNDKFLSCLAEMRQYASSATADLQCPVMRFLQIEEYLGRHVATGVANNSVKPESSADSAQFK